MPQALSLKHNQTLECSLLYKNTQTKTNQQCEIVPFYSHDNKGWDLSQIFKKKSQPLILQYCDTQLFHDMSVAGVSGGDGSKHTQQQTHELADTPTGDLCFCWAVVIDEQIIWTGAS